MKSADSMYDKMTTSSPWLALAIVAIAITFWADVSSAATSTANRCVSVGVTDNPGATVTIVGDDFYIGTELAGVTVRVEGVNGFTLVQPEPIVANVHAKKYPKPSTISYKAVKGEGETEEVCTGKIYIGEPDPFACP